MDFVNRLGAEFVFRGEPILFSGLGVGSWLNMEHFMLGIPTPDLQIRQAFAEVFGTEKSQSFFEAFTMQFLKDEDFVFLKNAGVNVIRVPFNHRLFIDDENPDVYKEEGFRYFDRLVALCKKHEIFLLPDLHTAPGGQNPDWHSDNQTGVPQFWHFGLFRRQIAALWKAIAERYAEETWILGYDLLNEPFLIPPREGMLHAFYQEVTEAIREVDQNHLLFLEGDYFAMDFSALLEIQDEQTALTFHFYPTVWEPDLFERDYDKAKRKEAFENRLCALTEGLKRFGRPYLCGEAGYDMDWEMPEHTKGLVEDTLSLFQKYRISYTLWDYKDARFMGVVYPKKDSLWMKFVEEIHTHWTHYGEMAQAKEIVAAMCKEFPNQAGETLQYHLQFMQRGILYRLQKETILKPQLERWGYDACMQMTKDFMFENCESTDWYVELLKGCSL